MTTSSATPPAATEPGGVTRRRAVVVIGVGRSGTSAITRGLQAVGVELGDDLKRGRGKNPTGFFEDETLRQITNRLKRVLGIRGRSVRLIEAQEWESPAVRDLQAEAAAVIAERFGGFPLWGFKHGRTLRVLPFWREVFRRLDLEVAYVIAVRNPLSVARSRARLDERRGEQAKSDLEWVATAVPYLPLVREHRFVVVDYDLVMEDPIGQLERVAHRLRLPVNGETQAAIRTFAEQFLRPGLRHSRFTVEDLARDPNVNALVRDGYGWLSRLATDRIAGDDPGLWQDWERLEREVQGLAPILLHVDRVENDLWRAKRSFLGPLQAVPDVWRKLRGR